MKRGMKSLVWAFTAIILCWGCSNEDDFSGEEEFLHAKVNGENFNASIDGDDLYFKKEINSNGTIDLILRGRSRDQKIIQFAIRNYMGSKRYIMGNKSSLHRDHFLNGNWCDFSEETTGLVWSTKNLPVVGNLSQSYVEIDSDNGNMISGAFLFDAYDNGGNDRKSVSEGIFQVEIRP